jgi:hypothetical protein
MKSFFLLAILALFLSLTVIAQTIDINAQIRPRAEYRHGYKSLIGDGVDPAFAISQRSRLNMNYVSKTFKTVLSIQDVRIWGDAATANKSDVNGTMLHQAWGEFFVTETFSLKAGRQVITYDDQRLFGALDWVQQGRSHDAFLVKYSPVKKVAMHVGIAYNQSADKDTGNFYSVNNYKALQYFWSHYGGEKLGVSLLFANNGMPQNTIENGKTIQNTRYSQTFGPYITYKTGNLKINAAGYLQTGKNAKNVSKSAYFASGEITYSATKQLSIGGGVQYLSGNSQVEADTEDHEFSTLYSTGHKFNGWMDYFYAGSAHQAVGLVDIYVPLMYKVNKLTAEFQLHYFNAAADVKNVADPTKAMDSGLGTEADLMLTYAISPEMSISGGYSQMFGTETLQALKGGNYENSQNWAWIMFTFNPSFFKSEK